MEEHEQYFERIDDAVYRFDSKEHHDAIERSIKWRFDMLQQGPYGHRFRADQTEFLARDLLFVQRDVQKVLFERLRAAEFVPIRSELPRGAESWAYRQQEIVGEARVGAHLSADDPPSAEVGTEEFQHPTMHLSASYQYTVDELEKAAFAQRPLARDKAEAAAEIIARGLDRVLREGEATLGVTGFFNNPNVPVLTLTNGEWDSTGTIAEIIADFAEIEQEVIDQSRDVHAATRLLLPTTMEGELATREKAAESDLNLKQWLLRNARMIQMIERWFQLDSTTTDNTTVTDPPLGIAYDPNPLNTYADVPIPYEEETPQQVNWCWKVPARAMTTGVVFKRPLSALYIENLD